MLKKTIKIAAIALIIILGASISYIYFSGPKLPPETDKIIQNVIDKPLPEFISGQTGYATNGDIKIWYESLEPKDSARGSVLLIMGISNDALAWPPKFISSLLDKGYRVIRYDHRGCGLSDWLEDWSKKEPYNLSDMSNDGLAVLDALSIDEAHFIGVSMGGMIAQQTAIEHPSRVKTLTSVMSSGYIMDPELPELNMNIVKDFVLLFLKYGLFSSEKNAIKLQLASRIILMGDSAYQINTKEISELVLYNLRRRNGFNMRVSEQHNKAVYISGSRYDGLKNLKMPTLIIHGTSDPFVPFEHGEKCAALITHAETLWVEGMGHDIPNIFNHVIINEIIDLFKQTH